MASTKLTNVLLLVIAACFVTTIVGRLQISIFPEALAQSRTVFTEISGCFKELEVSSCERRPIRVDEKGQIIISPQKGAALK